MIGLLKYYIKKRAYIVGIISLILIFIAIIESQDGYVGKYSYSGDTTFSSQNNPIGLYTVFGSILSTIVPLFEFNFKMRKVSVDEFYKLPIKREKLYLVKYIIGLLEVLIPMTVFFLFTLIDISLSFHLFKLSYYVIFYLLSIPLLTAIYSLIAFVYSKCNTTYDGLINVGLAQFFVLSIAFVILEIITNRDECIYFPSSSFCSDYTSYFYIYSPMTRLNVYYSNLMEGTIYESLLKEESFIITLVSIGIFLVLGIVSFILMITLKKYEKSEDSMDISNSWFSYKVMVPTYITVLTALIAGQGEAITLLLVIIAGYILYAIYRRNFKIKLYDIITGVSCIVGGIILGALIW